MFKLLNSKADIDASVLSPFEKNYVDAIYMRARKPFFSDGPLKWSGDIEFKREDVSGNKKFDDYLTFKDLTDAMGVFLDTLK